MLFNKAAIFTAVAALSELAFGQGPTPEGQTKVHVVQVGDTEGNLRFYPEELTALPGEMIQFHFYPKNHSVVQSSFADPCIPIADSPAGNGTEGFFSGFMPVTKDSELMPTFTIPVLDEKPIWFYCATGPHCQNGMVGVINAPKNNPDRTLAKYREAASKVKAPNAPDSEFGGEDGDVPFGSPNATQPTGTYPPGQNPPKSTATNTGVPDSDGAAPSSFAVSGLSVVLGAIAAAFFLA